MTSILKFIIIANVVDAIMTVLWVGLGIREANPIFAQMVYQPVTFMFVKVSLVGICVLVLHEHRDRVIAQYGVKILACAYSMLLLWHIIGSVLVVTH